MHTRRNGRVITPPLNCGVMRHITATAMAGVDRSVMERSLKEQCVPTLRGAGFKGSFPDFYRDVEGFVALVNFQFYSSGGSFCVNLSYADPKRTNVSFRPETATRELRVSQTRERCRLGGAQGDRWFSFGATSAGEFRGQPVDPSELVRVINGLLASEAESWWQSKRVRQQSA
jgi:uncharacterized protein DUF4304